MRNKRVQITDLTVAYRNYESASRSIKMSLLKRASSSDNHKIALQNLSLTAFEGDVIGVLGRNGSGKSTLVKAISGMVTPLHGRIITDGLITSIIELGAGLNNELTCRENVKLHSAIYGLPRSDVDSRSERICEWAGLMGLIDTPIKTFSSGMLARFSFALVTDIQPKILILDEVLSVGDIDFQEKSLQRTLELMGSGTTVFLVSHNLDTIREFANRAIWLDSGMLRFEGTPDDTCREYQKSFKA